jgi:predicted Zn-dependent protease
MMCAAVEHALHPVLQISTAEKHLQAALLLDPAMAMVRVDLAQNLLLTGCASQALAILDEALGLAKQVSEIRDVLTARTIASMQMDLEERGLYCSSGARSINC